MPQQQTILIVEDTQASASTLEIALNRFGQVKTLPEGASAWRYLQLAGDVRAVVTDLQMPGMDGFELIEKIRSDPRYDTLPIIVISGSTEPGIPARVMALGASAFFGKPFSPAQVRAKLEQLLDGTPMSIPT